MPHLSHLSRQIVETINQSNSYRRFLEMMKNPVSYTRRSLALCYFPEALPETAVRRLTGRIKRGRPLYAELIRNGSRPFDKRKMRTLREVRLIKTYLGDPEEPL